MSCSTYSKSGEFVGWAMFSSVLVHRLSMQTTLYPSESSLSQRWLPTKPAPPVTSARFLGTTEAPIVDPGGLDLLRDKRVATVHQQGRPLHQRGRTLEVQLPKFIPLSHQHRCVDTRQ